MTAACMLSPTSSSPDVRGRCSRSGLFPFCSPIRLDMCLPPTRINALDHNGSGVLIRATVVGPPPEQVGTVKGMENYQLNGVGCVER